MSAGAAGAAIAIINAIQASGVIVRLSADDFQKIVDKIESPLIVSATGGFISTNYQYLTSYKGLAFFTKSPSPLEFSGNVELVVARKIWVPG